uniref:Neprosin PEP catalytic domain-containing protein n=1 Tax=Kalanchoe fedtschenkoi TaxID=63787 RepID=A0A7N0V5D8_KALFE
MSVWQSEDDVIDCIDIYQQPAFDHPLLKDHKIEMVRPQMLESNASRTPVFYQKWRKRGECPEGTVPIKRLDEVDEELIMKMKRGGPFNNNVSFNSADAFVHEYSTVRVEDGTYYGTKFAVTLWNPHVEPKELSLGQAWLGAGLNEEVNTIEVGWLVLPSLFNDLQTRFFIFWTVSLIIMFDGSFVIAHIMYIYIYIECGYVSSKVILGDVIAPISKYGSQSYDIQISVYKAKGNWWLELGGEIVGYWPAQIFTHLSRSATRVQWGGEIVNTRTNGHHTTTQMGSGHFASERYSKAALFYNLQLNTIEDSPTFQRPRYVSPFTVSNGNCYSLLRAQYQKNFGDHFFYGGPGYSSSCP